MYINHFRNGLLCLGETTSIAALIVAVISGSAFDLYINIETGAHLQLKVVSCCICQSRLGTCGPGGRSYMYTSATCRLIRTLAGYINWAQEKKVGILTDCPSYGTGLALCSN
jgi:hypothetical protein